MSNSNPQRFEWADDNRVKLLEFKQPKKITGKRFAALFNANPFSSPFQVWCEIVRAYEEPFVGNKFTDAGNIIEPRQAKYMAEHYGKKIITPSDVYGEDYYKKTWGDFYPGFAHLGGMWDYLVGDPNQRPEQTLEMKTAMAKKQIEWDGKEPENYALQLALYAFLNGTNQCGLVVSFLEPTDYDHLEDYVCSPDNTQYRPFLLDERYPRFYEDYIQVAEKWWKDYVVAGLSPQYDERRDAKFLEAMHEITDEDDIMI